MRICDRCDTGAEALGQWKFHRYTDNETGNPPADRTTATDRPLDLCPQCARDIATHIRTRPNPTNR